MEQGVETQQNTEQVTEVHQEAVQQDQQEPQVPQIPIDSERLPKSPSSQGKTPMGLTKGFSTPSGPASGKLQIIHGTDAIRSIRTSHLKDRETHMDQLIADLKAKNEALKTNLVNKPQQRGQEDFDESEHDAKLETLGEEKKNLEKELAAVQNRIKHIMAESSGIANEISSYDQKTKKILEARAKKLQWEKDRQKELEAAQKQNETKRQELVKKAELRNQITSQKRDQHYKEQENRLKELKDDKQVNEILKAKVTEYEKMLIENKRLQMMATTAPVKTDKVAIKQQKKEKIETEVAVKTTQIQELDKKLENLKKLEQKMLEDKMATMARKGALEGQFQDIQNRKLEEGEIQELLQNREKNIKVPHSQRKVMDKILEVVNEENKALRARSPGAPTKFVGGNIGNNTELRKQVRLQKDGEVEPAKKPAVPRFASPQHRLMNGKKQSEPAPVEEPKHRNVKPALPTAAHVKHHSKPAEATGADKPKPSTTIPEKREIKKHPSTQITKTSSTRPATQAEPSRLYPTPASPKKEPKKMAGNEKVVMKGKAGAASSAAKPEDGEVQQQVSSPTAGNKSQVQETPGKQIVSPTAPNINGDASSKHVDEQSKDANPNPNTFQVEGSSAFNQDHTEEAGDKTEGEKDQPSVVKTEVPEESNEGKKPSNALEGNQDDANEDLILDEDGDDPDKVAPEHETEEHH